MRARQDWAAAQLREWYLFPDLLATGVDPARYATVDDYVDALTAPARAQRRDRNFTYLTSIREEDAYYDNGTSEGFGFQLGFVNDVLLVREAYEGAPALAAGMDRGTVIEAIGTSEATARPVRDLLAEGGGAAVAAALGTGAAGEARYFRFYVGNRQPLRSATITSASYTLQPVSPRYGVQIFDAPTSTISDVVNGQPVFEHYRRTGYLNLRTFVSTADQPMRDAFARFRAAGITDLIVDLRYNGGGLVSSAELLADLIGGARSADDVQSRMTFRPDKAGENVTRRFQPRPESVATVKVAFLTGPGTASASELVINAMTPYLRSESVMVGQNSYGKPVGQIAIDRSECDDRLRIVAFATQNAAGRGDYYGGLRDSVEATCAATDFAATFDTADALISIARSRLARPLCTPMTVASASGDAAPRSLPPEPLRARRPNAAQQHIEGLF
ncbi:MAG: S41 family peptidase [Sphingomonas fennica]